MSSLTSRIYGGQQGKSDKIEAPPSKEQSKEPQPTKTNPTGPSGK